MWYAITSDKWQEAKPSDKSADPCAIYIRVPKSCESVLDTTLGCCERALCKLLKLYLQEGCHVEIERGYPFYNPLLMNA
jgi:hypothetical protein